MNTEQTFDRFDLRKAFGCFGTGVTIVTTQTTDGRWVGLTVNSFSSVSLDPPIVLWSLQKSSPNLHAFESGERFVVNVLAQDQLSHSRRFASPVANKFEGVSHRLGIAGLPVLEGCAATFECRKLQGLEVGDHMLYLGQVQAYEHQHQPPLLFVQGDYARHIHHDLKKEMA
jgi:flavin reductase (DIM6/NTAB) family NADH-FMN oxidoreductase RutF